ncbi:MAG: DNA mismatch repair endonuclease MutL [Desulfobacterales bacterium]|nr:DNA mismatch repair endonuclease MutL [Desulfobacterales bacterium]
MPRVRILPEILSNKIAAGEVVERPASAVKELVENALDAGATRILIDVEQGGRGLLRVADNGAGMSRDDALLAVERYATSKLAAAEDLFNIRTLGFRGEALPSIAAVSRFSLVTREAAADSGTDIAIEGGRILSVAEAGAPPGTMVTVRELFFNTPARLKFLKSVGTEAAHIADIVSGMALAWPEVQFRLAHNGRIVKDLPAADPFDRAAGVLGASLKSDLCPVGSSLEGVTVGGWVSSPRVHRRSSASVFIFVNNRLVRDRLVQHALFQGYTQRLVKGQFPLAVLFIGLPFDEVDVNVHPSKTEVRFARSNSIHEAVRRAVAQALYDAERPGFRPRTPETNRVREGEKRFGEESAPGRRSSLEYRGPATAELLQARQNAGDGEVGPGDRDEAAFDNRGWKPLPQEGRDAEEGERGSEHRVPAMAVHPQKDEFPGLRPPASVIGSPASGLQPSAFGLPPQTTLLQTEIWEKKGFAGMRVIGQLKNAYILCEAEEGLVLIDQHAAHERILYEQLGRGGGAGSQALLVPETVELGFREARALEAAMPALRESGLEVEPFGGATVVVKAIPAVLAGREAGPLLLELAAAAAAAEGAPEEPALLERFRHLAACHAAIRSGQVLSLAQMQALLVQMDACANPCHCPHGRPTYVTYELGVIERAFKRT